MVGVADARQHQQLRRVEGAARQDHLVARGGVLHGAGFAVRPRRGAIEPGALAIVDALHGAGGGIDVEPGDLRVEPDRQPSGLAVTNFLGRLEDRRVIFTDLWVDRPTRTAVAIHGFTDVVTASIVLMWPLAEIRRRIS